MLWVINAANKVLYPVRYRQGININGTSPSVYRIPVVPGARRLHVSQTQMILMDS